MAYPRSEKTRSKGKQSISTVQKVELQGDWKNYGLERNRINAEIQRIKKEHWERFNKTMESDLYEQHILQWPNRIHTSINQKQDNIMDEDINDGQVTISKRLTETIYCIEKL